MAKYILKESELRSVMSEIIMEELSLAMNESFFKNAVKATGKLVGNGLGAALDPGDAINKFYTNMTDKNKTITGAIGRAFDEKSGTSNKNGVKYKKEKEKSKTRQEKRKEKTRNITYLKYNYGEPKTDVAFGGRKIRKERIVVSDYLGTGQEMNFGVHFVEKNQNSQNSIWSSKLREAQEEVSGNMNQQRAIRFVTRELKEWLKERDLAYKEAWGSIK